jgi:hypothetical protein
VQIFSLQRVLVLHNKNCNTSKIFTPLLHKKKINSCISTPQCNSLIKGKSETLTTLHPKTFSCWYTCNHQMAEHLVLLYCSTCITNVITCFFCVSYYKHRLCCHLTQTTQVICFLSLLNGLTEIYQTMNLWCCLIRSKLICIAYLL